MVWIAAFNKDNPDHDKASAILERIRLHDNRIIFTSDYVFNEIFGFITKNQRHGNLTSTQREAAIKKVMTNIYDSTTVSIEMVSEFIFGTAIQYLQNHSEISASLTDWTIFLIATEEEIPIVASFDADFRKIVKLSEFSKIKIWDS